MYTNFHRFIDRLQMPYIIAVWSVLTVDYVNMICLDESTFNVKLVDGDGSPLASAKITWSILLSLFFLFY